MGDAVLVLLSMVSRCDVGFDAVVGLALAVELFGCLCDRVSSLRGEISGGFTPYKCFGPNEPTINVRRQIVHISRFGHKILARQIFQPHRFLTTHQLSGLEPHHTKPL